MLTVKRGGNRGRFLADCHRPAWIGISHAMCCAAHGWHNCRKCTVPRTTDQPICTVACFEAVNISKPSTTLPLNLKVQTRTNNIRRTVNETWQQKKDVLCHWFQHRSQFLFLPALIASLGFKKRRGSLTSLLCLRSQKYPKPTRLIRESIWRLALAISCVVEAKSAFTHRQLSL